MVLICLTHCKLIVQILNSVTLSENILCGKTIPGSRIGQLEPETQKVVPKNGEVVDY